MEKAKKAKKAKKKQEDEEEEKKQQKKKWHYGRKQLQTHHDFLEPNPEDQEISLPFAPDPRSSKRKPTYSRRDRARYAMGFQQKP